MNCSAKPRKQTAQIQTHESYWPHITKQCNTHQLTKVQPVAWLELFLVQTLPFQSLLYWNAPNTFSSKTKMTLQELTTSLQAKTGTGSQGREDRVLIKYLCSLQFLSSISLLKNYSSHSTWHAKQGQVPFSESEEKTAWGHKNMLKTYRTLDIIETEELCKWK